MRSSSARRHRQQRGAIPQYRWPCLLSGGNALSISVGIALALSVGKAPSLVAVLSQSLLAMPFKL